MPSAFPWRSAASNGTGSATLTARTDSKSPLPGHDLDDAPEELPLDLLPSPVTAAASTTSKSKKSVRIVANGPAKSGLRVHWARLKQRISPDISPSTTSELADGSSNGLFQTSTRVEAAVAAVEKLGPVDTVVVDRSWFGDATTSCSQSQSDQELGGKPPALSASVANTSNTVPDYESLPATGLRSSSSATVLLRYRLWPAIYNFFSLRFGSKEAEEHYQKEHWYMNKSLFLWSSLFIILHAVLTAATLTGSPPLSDKIFYYAIGPVMAVALPFMIIFDFPRDRPVIYQLLLTVTVWMWACYSFIFIWGCGFYTKNLNPEPYKPIFSCGSKDFIATFLFATAIPTVGLFGMGQKRISALIGVLFAFTLGCVLILRWRLPWYRNLIQTLLYHLFVIYLHYARENAERRMYSMRDILKMQYKATQKAQVNERNAGESKRRLTSYIFHEVRVPLNSALLAVQNMAAAGVFRKSHELEFTALEGSLSMMTKVLNDMLDFNRLDAGRFESVSRPFSFHQVMKTLCVPLRMATVTRELRLIIEYDPLIDQFARRAAGDSEEAILARPNDPGIMLGDEMRLRQIVNNLVSNACKFTPPGGTITVKTKLVWPTSLAGVATGPHPQASQPLQRGHFQSKHSGTSSKSTSRGSSDVTAKGNKDGNAAKTAAVPVLSADALQSHNALHQTPKTLDKIVVRIEVHDTGVGLKSNEFSRDKLFTPFNQTEQGRLQGGKGTGLGLALVRQIVKRSGGRLGVYSAGPNQGSIFWVELLLEVGPRALVATADTSTELLDLTTRTEPSFADFNLMYPRAPSAATNTDSRRASSLLKRPPPGMVSQSVVRSLVADDAAVLGSHLAAATEDQNPVLHRMAVSDAPATPAALANKTSFIDSAAVLSSDALGSSSDTVTTPEMSPASIAANPVSVVPMLRLGLGDLKAPVPPMRTISDPLPSAPSTPSSAASPPVAASAPSHPWPSGMPVLVVDDDSLTRQLMRRLLMRLGCHVTTAHNGMAALELMMDFTPRSEEALTLGSHESAGAASDTPLPQWWSDSERYAVCLLDNMMPVLSGVDAVAKLRAAGRRDFVVGVTGNAMLSDQQEYTDAGADFVLTKPVLEKSLRQVLILAEERRRKQVLEKQEGASSLLLDPPKPRAAGSSTPRVAQ
ncbi:hypothetical protein BKA62DRAFT_682198 [Auriculariales sp. MPI-PUGE-AT-0066]|nr:hypothetical protein BKA62DRAFT_682198 [Auriculariales sp. MPI-PUGE-AT-0066]